MIEDLSSDGTLLRSVVVVASARTKRQHAEFQRPNSNWILENFLKLSSMKLHLFGMLSTMEVLESFSLRD
jgi:hypothetical protein